MSQILKINTGETGTKISIKRELVPVNDPILKVPCPEWDWARPPMPSVNIANELIEALKDNNGIGLACPQVGLSYRMFVMGLDKNIVAFFNPRILEESDKTQLLEEGCLSFPGLRIKIRRPEWIHVAYQDYLGKHHEAKFGGLTARIFSHGLDHLNGIIFTDRAGKMALQVAKNKKRKKDSK
jgi:peptide deformylase